MAEQKNAQNVDVNQLLKVRREKLQDLQERGKDPFQITKYDMTHHSMEIKDNFDELEGKTVSIAGRMMFKRVMGKASFCNIQDLQGSIQSYVARDNIGEESYADFKKYDVGDILGIKGEVFKTKTGEISIHATEVTLLSKSLQVLPEKFHGLTDTDTRYRQRYVDLIMNPEVKDTFIKRSKVISSIRRFLDAQGFMEVETPMLVSNAGGAAARPFETHFNALNEDLKLRISLELYLKRLIVGGMERVYEIGRVFRNEGLDTRHNPEFTLMELYQAYTDYHGMMDLTENLYRHVAKEVTGSEVITYGEHTMDLSKPFARITMIDAVKQYANVDFNEIHSTEEAKKVADEHHIEYEERHQKGDILNLFFEEYVEEHLIQPTFIMDHPVEISPLTKKKPEDPDYVERFEFFMNGWEMANVPGNFNDISKSLTEYQDILQDGTSDIAGTIKCLKDLKESIDKIKADIQTITSNSSYQDFINAIKDNPQVIVNFISSPVQMNTVAVYEISNYGSAMAPFYTVLALWVGALILVALIHVKVKDNEELEGVKPYQKFFGRYLNFFVIGQVQTIITVMGDLFYVGIQCKHPIAFALAAMITSFVFTFLIYSLTVAFGNIGEAIAVIIMVIQVAGAGGTFPVEVLPSVYQYLYKFMPFSYCMNALRECVAGMYQHTYGKCLATLLIYVAISAVIGLLLAKPCAKLLDKLEHSKEKSGLFI